MAVTFNNATFTAGQSTTGAYLAGSFTGANTLSGAVPVTINGTVGNPGSTVQVNLNVAGVTSTGAQGTYLGYSAVPNSQDYVYYFNVTGANLVTPVTIGVTPAPALPSLSTATGVTTSTVTAPASLTPVCFATGTHIRTTRGEIAVEDLAIGDVAVTADGGTRPIVWIGHRRQDCAAHRNPIEVLPVRIRAGALTDNLPGADLVVSPGHRFLIEGRLVCAESLVNGWTIVRDAVEAVTYWHVELDQHDLLVAEGVAAESYLDVGNRIGFDNAGNVHLLQADLDGLRREDGRCAPMIDEAELATLKARLLDRAGRAGARYTADAEMVVLADGWPLGAAATNGDRVRFLVPAGTRELSLASRAAVPAQVMADNEDRRLLGLFVHDLEIDGRPVPLDGAAFAWGWHDLETNGWGTGRWSTGEAALPIGRVVSFAVETMPVYPLDRPSLAATATPRLAERLRAAA